MIRMIAVTLLAALASTGASGTALCNDGFDWGGWLSSGIHANAWGTADNGPLGTKRIGNAYTVEQLWGFAEKTLDTSGGWDFGGRVDCMFGSDASSMQAFGDGSWDADWNSSDDYGSAMPQLFGEVGFGDFKLKAGRFLTSIGWECVDDPPNFFSSNSYSYFYAEPATHTGVLGTWEAGDALTFHAGWTNGWDAGFTDNGGASTFLGGITWTGIEDLTVTYFCSAGSLNRAEGDVYMHSLVFELALTERLAWVLHNDFAIQSGLSSGDDALWTGIVQYLQYDLTDTLGAGIRFEWFQDRDAARVDPGQISGNFYELTAGLNWRPTSRLIIRPELRYDWFAGTYVPGCLPFNDGTDDQQFSGGFDVIVTF